MTSADTRHLTGQTPGTPPQPPSWHPTRRLRVSVTRTVERVGRDDDSKVVRALWTLAGLILVMWALRLSGAMTMFPEVGPFAVLAGIWGLGIAVAAWLPRPPTAWRWAAWMTALVVLLAFAVWAYLQLYGSAGYGTDEIAFDQYAAHLFLHGLDPYRYSMAPAMTRYHVSPDGFTYKLNGQPVTALSYPALAFLVYALPVLWGWGSQAANIVDIGAWAVATALLFCVVPRGLRPLALILGSLSVYISYAAGGVTDAVFVPLLIGAVVGWDQAALSRGWRSWRSPVLMGLAMAIKQTPWFVMAFLLVGIFMEGHDRDGSWRRALVHSARYFAISMAAFMVPNLWFILVSPRAWVHGVLAPFGGHVVPAGQGLVGLSIASGVGGGSLFAYTAAAVAVLLFLGALEVSTWPALRAPLVLLPSLVLFFATRSFGSYLVELVPAAVAAAVTLGPLAAAPTGWAARNGTAVPRTPWQLLLWGGVAATGLLTAMTIGLALLSPSPLRMRIVSLQTTGQYATIDTVSVRVQNRSPHSLKPTFSLEDGGVLTTFWRVADGPELLRPGQAAVYTLLPTNGPAMPPLAAGFQVVAFTESPDTISRTAPDLQPARYHLALIPDAVNHPLTVGQALTVRVQLLGPFDRPESRAGVLVDLSQVIYREQGPELAMISINGAAPGRAVGTALTNGQGVATFVVVAKTAYPDPVFLQANLVDQAFGYPYAYSPSISVYVKSAAP